MKQKLRIVKVFVITISILMVSLGCSANVSAANEKTKSSKPWASAYSKLIKKIDKEYSDPDTKITYDLIYFNNDKIPELVAGHIGYWVSMYTYDNGKVYTVMDHWPYGAMGNVGYTYYPKKGILQNYNNDFAGVRCYVYYGTMKNHQIVDLYKKTLRVDYFDDKNKNGYPDENEILTDSCIYYYGDKKISEKKYLSYQVKGKTKEICGFSSKNKILKKLK